MQPSEQRALMAIALLAAFADGQKADAEREEVKRIAASLTPDGGAAGTVDMAALYQDVLLGRIDVSQAAAALAGTGQRQLAYELAVCVCDADGVASDAERKFLERLKAALGLGAAQTAEVEQQAEAIAAVPAVPSVATAAPVGAPKPSDAELDATILQYAVLNGALELLPQSWASMAIIPLQMKLVYRIGQAHGVALDSGHVKEFIATAGVGLTSQYLEQMGRKLLGGLLGSFGGGIGRALGGTATGIAFSFASTYALGQLAKRYYAGGRQMNTALLQQTFQSLLGPAKNLQTQYLPQIRQKAQSLDAKQIAALVRGA